MKTYVLLIRFIEEGNLSERRAVAKIKAGSAAAEKIGIKVKETHWSTGGYDAVLVADAPDHRTIKNWTNSLEDLSVQPISTFSEDDVIRMMAKPWVPELSYGEIIQWSY